MEEKVKQLEKEVNELRALMTTFSNTLHVVDAAALLSVYSLIKTENLRQPDFTTNQDIIDSGCSDAISRMITTATIVTRNEHAKDKSKKR